MKPWVILGGLGIVIAVYAVACWVLTGCLPPPAQVEHVTVVEGRAIVDYAAKLEACREVGRDAGSYAAYAACEKEAGL